MFRLVILTPYGFTNLHSTCKSVLPWGGEASSLLVFGITSQSGCHCFLWFAYFCRWSFLFILWLKVNYILYLPNTPYVAKKIGSITMQVLTSIQQKLLRNMMNINHSENSTLVSLRDFWFYKVGEDHHSTVRSSVLMETTMVYGVYILSPYKKM